MGELALKVRAKYPGAYDAIPDAELESKVMAKFPGVYDHLAGDNAPLTMGYTPEQLAAAEQAGIASQQATTPMEKLKVNVADTARKYAPAIRTTLEAGGAMAGGAIGAIGGAAAGMGIGSIPAATVGGVTGSSLGYAAGKNIADTIDEQVGLRDGGSMGDRLATTGKDLLTGAAFDVGGRTVMPAVGFAAKQAGKVIKPVLGRLSGVGTEAIEQGLKSGEQATGWNVFKSQTAYDRAMRGKMSGEEVVDTARGALNTLKDARLNNYQAKLSQIETQTGNINKTPINDELTRLMNNYKVKIDPATGAIDTSRIAMGKTGRNDIAEIIDTVQKWGGQAGDDTAVGLDTLKRQLDDFYSDSSQARQFVTSLKKKVSDTISAAVPEYGEMTKGYAEATKLIKDVESALMLRKQGMSGRIVADQTLNRMMSAMRNDGIKKEMIDILGTQGGADLMGAVAGYSASNVVPRGLSGTGPAILGSAALAKFVDPTFAGVILASSPRVQGEFLRLVGRTRGFDTKFIDQTVKSLAIANRPKTAQDAQDRLNAMKEK